VKGVLWGGRGVGLWWGEVGVGGLFRRGGEALWGGGGGGGLWGWGEGGWWLCENWGEGGVWGVVGELGVGEGRVWCVGCACWGCWSVLGLHFAGVVGRGGVVGGLVWRGVGGWGGGAGRVRRVRAGLG